MPVNFYQREGSRSGGGPFETQAATRRGRPWAPRSGIPRWPARAPAEAPARNCKRLLPPLSICRPTRWCRWFSFAATMRSNARCRLCASLSVPSAVLEAFRLIKTDPNWLRRSAHDSVLTITEWCRMATMQGSIQPRSGQSRSDGPARVRVRVPALADTIGGTSCGREWPR